MLDKTQLPVVQTAENTEQDLCAYIPVVAHYDSHTLITKNGELVQTIEITGEGCARGVKQGQLRAIINKAICDSVDTAKIAVTTHVVRSRKSLMQYSNIQNVFARSVQNAWIEKNNFDKQLVNTIYVTFTYQSAYTSIVNIAAVAKSLFFKVFKRRNFEKRDVALAHLTKVVDSFLLHSAEVGSRRLGLLEDTDGVISEPLMFHYYLSHLENRKTYLPMQDISKYLSNMEIKYGFNTMEFSNPYGKQYAAIFSFKDHYNVAHDVIDNIMHLGMQFTLTQHHIFVPHKEATKEYKELADIANLSKAEGLNKLIGYDRILEADGSKVTDYCRLFSTMIIHSDEEGFFEDKVRQITKAFHDQGILVIREDFSMPQLFWAQMPGNYRYISQHRKVYADKSSIVSFASIFHEQSGDFQGNVWGEPVAILRSAKGMPFYFNFHDASGNGSTIVIGPMDAGKSTLSRFLMTNCLKYNPRIHYFDFLGESPIFADKVELRKVYLDEMKANFKINPFEMESIKSNPKQLCLWLAESLGLSGKLFEPYQEAIAAIAQRLGEGEGVVDKLGAIKAMITALDDAALTRRYEEFFEDQGRFASLFTQSAPNFDFANLGHKEYFNLQDLYADKQLFHTYFGLLFNHIVDNLDPVHPTIIYINDFIEFYKINFIQENFSNILEKIKSKNSILIATMQRDTTVESNDKFLKDIEGFGTRIFMSDRHADKYFKRAYQLDEDDLHKIKSYDTSRRMFLLKQGKISTVLSLNLSNLGDLLKTLASKV